MLTKVLTPVDRTSIIEDMKTLKYQSLNGKAFGAVEYDDTVDGALEYAQHELRKGVEEKAGWKGWIYKAHRGNRIVKLKVR